MKKRLVKLTSVLGMVAALAMTFASCDFGTKPVPVVETPAIKGVDGVVTITCATEGAKILYKVDSGAETAYTKPFTLEQKNEDVTYTVSAYAKLEGYTDSAVATEKVLVKGKAIVTTDDDGNKVVTIVNDDGTKNVTVTDAEGNVTESTIAANGDVESVTKDKDGNVVESISVKTDADGNVTTVVVDAEGTKVTEVEKADGTTETVTENADGSKVTITENADGTTETVTENADGSKVTETTDAEGNGQKTETDKDGNETKVEIVKVTFDSDGGSAVAPKNVNKGEKVAKPADPTKTGYTFAGWKLGTADYDFNAVVNEAITLKATWTIKEYTVTFDVDGTKTTKKVKHGDKVTKPEDPEKEGYDFSGWLNGETAYAFDTTTVTGDLTLTASWTEKAADEGTEYTITLESTEDNPYEIAPGGFCELEGTGDDETSYKAGDTVTFVIKGKAYRDITSLTLLFVDNALDTTKNSSDNTDVEQYGFWQLGYKSEECEITANEEFEQTIVMTIERDQIGTGKQAHRLRISAGCEEKVKIFPQTTDTAAKLEFELANVGLVYSSDTPVDLQWSGETTFKLDNAKFADLEEGKNIEFHFTKSGEAEAHDQWWEMNISSGTFGGVISLKSGDANKHWVISGEGIGIYTPTADEIEQLKKAGLTLMGDSAVDRVYVK